MKLIESIIREQIWDFLTKSEVLDPCQHRFVKHKFCFTKATTHAWASALDMGFGIDVIYLDYSKAFDSESVQHLRLISKLQAYGIKGDLSKWISNFLIGRQQKVILNGSS